MGHDHGRGQKGPGQRRRSCSARGYSSWISWAGSTLLGRLAGAFIDDPTRYGLDFAFTATFLVLLLGMWKGKTDIVPWAVAAASAILTAKLVPGNWYIIVGGLLGSLAGRPGRTCGGRAMSLEALITILGMAAVTYAIRAGGLLLANRLPTTGFVAAWLRHLPGAVLAALVAPAILKGGPAEWLAAAATALIYALTQEPLCGDGGWRRRGVPAAPALLNICKKICASG